MELESIILSEGTQTQKEVTVCSLSYLDPSLYVYIQVGGNADKT